MGEAFGVKKQGERTIFFVARDVLEGLCDRAPPNYKGVWGKNPMFGGEKYIIWGGVFAPQIYKRGHRFGGDFFWKQEGG